MTKSKTVFTCQECGCQSPRWLGRCPDCGKWNTITEELAVKETRYEEEALYREKPKLLFDVEMSAESRIRTNIDELDRILGGGIVPGSMILIGGDPGIGKSTLLLQASNQLSGDGGKVLYVSGEESVRQTKLRAERLGTTAKNLYIVNETNVALITKYIKELSPRAVVVDSIQVVYNPELSSSPGSVSQVKECAAQLVFLAKGSGIPIFLVGHVTKEGSIAGPRVLEHMVDTVLYFEGERHTVYRVLRAVKNRFGSTNEIGVFEMTARGLLEVSNPSQLFLSERPSHVSGSVVVPCIEGTRPLLVEIQALVSQTNFATPRRWTSGLDYNRVVLLIAVLEKRVGLALHSQDIFVNVAGGVKIVEPAVDLAAMIAVSSSFKEVPIEPYDVVLGEVGLGGEIRGVTQAEARINEAQRMGFKRCIISKNNLKGLSVKGEIELVGVSTIGEALEVALG